MIRSHWAGLADLTPPAGLNICNEIRGISNPLSSLCKGPGDIKNCVKHSLLRKYTAPKKSHWKSANDDDQILTVLRVESIIFRQESFKTAFLHQVFRHQ